MSGGQAASGAAGSGADEGHAAEAVGHSGSAEGGVEAQENTLAARYQTGAVLGQADQTLAETRQKQPRCSR